MEESGFEIYGDIFGIVFVWNCLYIVIKNYDMIIMLKNVCEFLIL